MKGYQFIIIITNEYQFFFVNIYLLDFLHLVFKHTCRIAISSIQFFFPLWNHHFGTTFCLKFGSLEPLLQEPLFFGIQKFLEGIHVVLKSDEKF